MQSRSQELETKVSNLVSQVQAQAALEECWSRLEAELKASVLQQQAELAKAKAALAAEGLSLRRAKEQFQSTLSRIMKEMDGDRVGPENGKA